MGGNPVIVWVNQQLGFVHLGMGQVIIGLLDGLLNGPDDFPVRKWIRAVLKILKGSKGFRAGPASTASSAGLGFPLESKCAKRPLLVGLALLPLSLPLLWERLMLFLLSQ